ncbi:hypothetical protein O988_06681, partial [Pseudogymnoascus sp. VKM F-3808]
TGAVGINKELAEMQDMYRLTLAASWHCGKGTLAADQCIEDIFNGGDGWGNKPAPPKENPTLHAPANGADDSEDEGMGTATPANQHQRRHHHHHIHDRSSGAPSRNGSGASKKHHFYSGKKARHESEMPGLTTTVDKKGNPIGGIRRATQRALAVEKPEESSSEGEEEERGRTYPDEVAEWDAREDLRAWTVPSVTVEDEPET